MKFLAAFIIGGILCVIGQLLIDLTKLTPARILVLYVVAGVVLTFLGIYEPIVEISGCGATIPLTGFGYSLANGVIEGINKQGILGVFCGGITATSGGISAAVFFGLIVTLIFKTKEKK